MELEQKDWKEIIENALTYIVVMAMLAYGFGKIIQFNGDVEINKPVTKLTGMQIMWAFYGYSKPYVLTLGFLEISGGIMILIKRTRILGCLLVSSILINVILQDIFYEVNFGALKAAIIYQILIFIIFYFNKNKLIQSLKILVSNIKVTHSKKKLVLKLLISFTLFIILRILEYYLTIKF